MREWRRKRGEGPPELREVSNGGADKTVDEGTNVGAMGTRGGR